MPFLRRMPRTARNGNARATTAADAGSGGDVDRPGGAGASKPQTVVLAPDGLVPDPVEQPAPQHRQALVSGPAAGHPRGTAVLPMLPAGARSWTVAVGHCLDPRPATAGGDSTQHGIEP